MVSGSITGAKERKKRGRKPKNADDASVAGGKSLTVVSGMSGKGRASRALSMDDDDDLGDSTEVAVVARTKEEKEKEKQHRAMLVEAFDLAQFSRYECWRSARLSDPIVRRVSFQVLIRNLN